MKTKIAKWMLLGLVAGGGIILLIWVITWLIIWNSFGFEPSGFDQSVWLAWHNRAEPDNPRYGMVDDVRTRLLRDQPTRPEVLELLGSPDAGQGANYLGYNLGVSFTGVDFDALFIYFDEEGRVAEVRVVQG